MSAINGDKSRHSIARKRGIHRRAKIRALVQAHTAASAKAPSTKAPAPKKPAAKPAR